MRGPILAVMGAWLLSACVGQASPPKTLAEKLEGKTPQEKQEVLRLACLTEAGWKERQDRQARIRLGWTRSASVPRYYPEVSVLKALCREMTASYLAGKE